MKHCRGLDWHRKSLSIFELEDVEVYDVVFSLAFRSKSKCIFCTEDCGVPP